jgi:uncharacterized protein (TIGR02058 family)
MYLSPAKRASNEESIRISNGISRTELEFFTNLRALLCCAQYTHHSFERERSRERVMFVRATSPFLLLSGSSSSSSGKSLSFGKRAMVNRFLLRAKASSSSETRQRTENVEKHDKMSKTLFVELGVGSDQHGQDGTKAAVRACKDAISFNSLPAIADLIPGGYGGMKLHVLVAAPIDAYPVDVDEVKKVFPYGSVDVELVRGGMVASSGIAIEAMGDGFDADGRANDDFIVVNAAVSVGY